MTMDEICKKNSYSFLDYFLVAALSICNTNFSLSFSGLSIFLAVATVHRCTYRSRVSVQGDGDRAARIDRRQESDR